MIDSNQTNLVQVIGFAHLVGELKRVESIPIAGLAAEPDEFFGIGLDAAAVGQELAQGRHAQKIREEPVSLSVPHVEEGTGTGETLRFAHFQRLVRGDLDRVLYDGVRPSHPHDVEFGQIAGEDADGRFGDLNFLVEIPGLEFDDGPDPLLVALEAVQLDLQPARGWALFFPSGEFSLACEGQKVEFPGSVQPGRNKGRGRLVPGRRKGQGAFHKASAAVGNKVQLSSCVSIEQIIETIAIEVCDGSSKCGDRLRRRRRDGGQRFHHLKFGGAPVEQDLVAVRRPQGEVEVAVVIEVGNLGVHRSGLGKRLT